MREEDLKQLRKPYAKAKVDIDRRFQDAIGANVSNAGLLCEEIIDDLDTTIFGVKWWTLPDEERILIGDYLYQCAYGIETNLAEAKLHYFEWLDAREKQNQIIADMVSFDVTGNPIIKYPPSLSPMDELPSKLEELHICGFFRAIGSALDCLGASIIGIVALPTKLRRSDIGTTEIALGKIPVPSNPGEQLQKDFSDFYNNTKNSSGVTDWLLWTNQYRNMLIHRGRLIVSHGLAQRQPVLLDAKGNIIFRSEATTHLSKFPDRSDVENWIKSKDIYLNEDADETLTGVFNSCKKFMETICVRLIDIWKQRRSNPTLLEQPITQWKDTPKTSNFNGFGNNPESLDFDLGVLSPVLKRRFMASASFDQQSSFWINSKWKL